MIVQLSCVILKFEVEIQFNTSSNISAIDDLDAFGQVFLTYKTFRFFNAFNRLSGISSRTLCCRYLENIAKIC